MKFLDIVHDYHDGVNNFSRGLCRVRSFLGPEGVVVLLTDLDRKNDGQSVTNAVESIIESLRSQGKVLGPAIFIEHYERDTVVGDTFDRVTIGDDGKPQWRTITKGDVLVLAAVSIDELADRSEKNKRVIEEADRIRFGRNPFVGSPYHEDNSVIKRRLEIMEKMISKKSVESLVAAGAIEQDIQRLLKQDLSIFGEVFSKPDDEYICFSEFPVDDGSVDVVVLTGRSRMDVIFIELKGADFNLVNSDHYAEFNHKINQAAGQIRKRLGYVYRNLLSYRDFVHEARQRAEAGEKVHNAFLGPKYKLGVDPNKDINIRTVVIGGRTVDDMEESRQRHDYETRFTPPIRIESWDTWLRRLKRQ
jgi:hypothetical protein